MEKHKVKGPDEACVKRALDILISFLVIVLFCWLYLILAIVVRLNLGSPILFAQERPGRNGSAGGALCRREMGYAGPV